MLRILPLSPSAALPVIPSHRYYYFNLSLQMTKLRLSKGISPELGRKSKVNCDCSLGIYRMTGTVISDLKDTRERKSSI